MKGFENGHKKVGGRTKGTQNKVNQAQTDRINQFFDTNWEEFITEVYPQLSPKDKKDTVIALMAYKYPKMSNVTVDGGMKLDTTITGILAQHMKEAGESM